MAYAETITEHVRRFGWPTILGQFRERDAGLTFQYAARDGSHDPAFAPDYPHMVYVDPRGGDTRIARVLKTVAHVVVDEDENGPVIEHWRIDGHQRMSA